MAADAVAHVRDAEAPEVGSNTPEVGVPPVDLAAFDTRGDEERHGLGRRLGHLDEPLDGEVVEVSDKPLELGDNAEHVRVAERSAHLERSTGSGDRADRGVRLGDRADGVESVRPPGQKRMRRAVGHGG